MAEKMVRHTAGYIKYLLYLKVASITIMANIWKKVVAFPSQLGLIFISPLRIYIIDKRNIMMISRLITASTIHAGMRKSSGMVFTADNDMKALAMSILSANGSRTIPKSVICVRLRAMPPSIASVKLAIANIAIGTNLK